MTYYNDPLSDLINRIRNAYMVRHSFVKVSVSKLKTSVIDLLVQEGYLTGYEIQNESKNITNFVIELKYYNDQPAIKEIHRFSKPGQRQYTKSKSIPAFYNGLGVSILSTSKGILTDFEARKLGVGGEVLLQVF